MQAYALVHVLIIYLIMSFGRAMASNQIVQIHPASVLFRTKPECFIYNELIQTTKTYVRNVTRIDPLWLPELAPQYYGTQS